MNLPFTPTWEKAAAREGGFDQFRYIFEKDVRKEWERGYGQLNEGRRMAVRFWWLIAELNNGGLDQYFWNFSGEFAAETVEDLKRIGQEPAATILLQASKKLFGDAPVPSETRQRRRAIETYYGTHPFNDDDDNARLTHLEDKEDLTTETRQLDGLRESMAIAIVAWMRANQSQFSHIKHP